MEISSRLFFKKPLYEVKGSGLQLSFDSPQLEYNGKKLYKTYKTYFRLLIQRNDFDFL